MSDEDWWTEGAAAAYALRDPVNAWSYARHYQAVRENVLALARNWERDHVDDPPDSPAELFIWRQAIAELRAAVEG